MSQVVVTLAHNTREVLPTVPLPLHRISLGLPPTPLSLYQQIPSACSWNLADILKQGVRHEENIYGYLNSLLTSIFLPSQRFQVNPQYPLRPRVPDGHRNTISVGSTGEMHSGRGSEREAEMQYPDFLITKPSPRPPRESQNRINVIIGIIEVKNPVDNDGQIPRTAIVDAVTQIGNYAKRVRGFAYAIREHNSPIVASYIIYGRYYTKVTTTGEGDEITFDLEPLQYVFEELTTNARRAPLSYRLCELAARHWDFERSY